MIVLLLPDVNDDDDLLARAKRGDKAAVGEIYNRYVESIYQFSRLRMADPSAAEDITSMVFEKLIKELSQGKGPRQHLRGWLFQVARYAIYDSYGEQPSLPIETIEQLADSNTASPEQVMQQSLDIETIRRLIRALSPDQQEILLLRFDQQLSLQETADIMHKHISTVKTLQYRAVKSLREMLERTGRKVL